MTRIQRRISGKARESNACQYIGESPYCAPTATTSLPEEGLGNPNYPTFFFSFWKMLPRLGCGRGYSGSLLYGGIYIPGV